MMTRERFRSSSLRYSCKNGGKDILIYNLIFVDSLGGDYLNCQFDCLFIFADRESEVKGKIEIPTVLATPVKPKFKKFQIVEMPLQKNG